MDKKDVVYVYIYMKFLKNKQIKQNRNRLIELVVAKGEENGRTYKTGEGD